MTNKRLIDPTEVVAQEMARRAVVPMPSSWTADLPDTVPDEPAPVVTIDPWEPHVFDGGPLGDFRCVGCGLTKAAPIHTGET